MKTKEVTFVELCRMKALADIGLPCGSIAKMIGHEFGTERNANDVRHYLRRYYDWHSGRSGWRSAAAEVVA